MDGAGQTQDASTVYARARKLVATLEYQLQQLEEGAPGASGPEACASLTENLNRLFREASMLDRAISDTTADSKRDLWRKRAAQLSAEALTLRQSVERYLKTTYAAKKELQERRMLLGGGGGADSVAVDAFLQERSSIMNSHAMLDDVNAAAASVMGALRGQRTTLKGVHKRVLDMGAALGVSNTLMRIIERRTTGDRILVYGGSLVILLLLGLLWWLTRR